MVSYKRPAQEKIQQNQPILCKTTNWTQWLSKTTITKTWEGHENKVGREACWDVSGGSLRGESRVGMISVYMYKIVKE